MWRYNLKIGTFKDKIAKHFQQMYVNQTRQIWTQNNQAKKNVRALSPVLPVVRKLAGGSGEKMNLIIGLLKIKFQS